MPALPTLTVTQTISDRLLAAFSGQVDSTGAPLTAVQAYKTWLRWALSHYVVDHEDAGGASTLENSIPLT